ncbi:uncharacterized protein MONOS_1445 [Monocercomonoides exilis]|uniref:uncharacterized protein n=1 Tax=Monocercomonoides exilis TaxID=2049356 RepID=UPI0035597A8F|nr:hypothetical protein MONOS_1445 [Monocercomonoides exilis]|eukprot:MONOS_1445.1-p1 / transcript=MONOS_1445.1 / gene=MONOS_1445 / organism=Monocercomonoides_exilis_PA203 / gene_product=unspecified product / transcript_product=unspecified product / location=Mono_scaffold00025:207914-211513(+) / protein_length=1200 / sequence_SO=supercontig / SO=protein_coding / is_pseudo=false
MSFNSFIFELSFVIFLRVFSMQYHQKDDQAFFEKGNIDEIDSIYPTEMNIEAFRGESKHNILHPFRDVLHQSSFQSVPKSNTEQQLLQTVFISENSKDTDDCGIEPDPCMTMSFAMKRLENNDKMRTIILKTGLKNTKMLDVSNIWMRANNGNANNICLLSFVIDDWDSGAFLDNTKNLTLEWLRFNVPNLVPSPHEDIIHSGASQNFLNSNLPVVSLLHCHFDGIRNTEHCYFHLITIESGSLILRCCNFTDWSDVPGAICCCPSVNVQIDESIFEGVNTHHIEEGVDSVVIKIDQIKHKKEAENNRYNTTLECGAISEVEAPVFSMSYTSFNKIWNDGGSTAVLTLMSVANHKIDISHCKFENIRFSTAKGGAFRINLKTGSTFLFTYNSASASQRISNKYNGTLMNIVCADKTILWDFTGIDMRKWDVVVEDDYYKKQAPWFYTICPGLEQKVTPAFFCFDRTGNDNAYYRYQMLGANDEKGEPVDLINTYLNISQGYTIVICHNGSEDSYCGINDKDKPCSTLENGIGHLLPEVDGHSRIVKVLDKAYEMKEMIISRMTITAYATEEDINCNHYQNAGDATLIFLDQRDASMSGFANCEGIVVFSYLKLSLQKLKDSRNTLFLASGLALTLSHCSVDSTIESISAHFVHVTQGQFDCDTVAFNKMKFSRTVFLFEPRVDVSVKATNITDITINGGSLFLCIGPESEHDYDVPQNTETSSDYELTSKSLFSETRFSSNEDPSQHILKNDENSFNMKDCQISGIDISNMLINHIIEANVWIIALVNCKFTIEQNSESRNYSPVNRMHNEASSEMCNWAEEAIKLTNCKSKIDECVFSNLKSGALQVTGSEAIIFNTLFENNGKNAEFQSFRKNIACSKGKISVEKMRGDGSDLDHPLFLRSDDCTLDGDLPALDSPFFMPVLDSVALANDTETQTTKLTFKGKLFIPCSLSFEIVFKKKGEIQKSNPYNFSLISNENTIEMNISSAELQRSKDDDSDEVGVRLVFLRAENQYVTGKYISLIKDPGEKPDEPTVDPKKEENKNNSTGLIIGLVVGLIGIIAFVIVVLLLLLQRRKRRFLKLGSLDSNNPNMESMKTEKILNSLNSSYGTNNDTRANSEGKSQSFSSNDEKDPLMSSLSYKYMSDGVPSKNSLSIPEYTRAPLKNVKWIPDRVAWGQAEIEHLPPFPSIPADFCKVFLE